MVSPGVPDLEVRRSPDVSSYRPLTCRSFAVPDCAIAADRPVPAGPLMSGPAGDLAGGLPAALSLVPAPAVRDDLLELLAGVTDGRPGQGRDHPVAAVLAPAAAAVIAGSRSFTAIAGWAAGVPAELMEDLYRRPGIRPRGRMPGRRRSARSGGSSPGLVPPL